MKKLLALTLLWLMAKLLRLYFLLRIEPEVEIENSLCDAIVIRQVMWEEFNSTSINKG